jgi:hypothetical protein
MARFFIPSKNAASNPAKNIPSELWLTLDEKLTKDSIVLVGTRFKHNKEVDLVILTEKKAHVIESKKRIYYPIIYHQNEGLCTKNGEELDPIIGNHGKLAISQARDEREAVIWELEKASIYFDTSAYVLVPKCFQESNVDEAKGLDVFVALGIENLLSGIHYRDKRAIQKPDDKWKKEYGRTYEKLHTEQERIDFARSLHLTETTVDHLTDLSKNIQDDFLSDSGNNSIHSIPMVVNNIPIQNDSVSEKNKIAIIVIIIVLAILSLPCFIFAKFLKSVSNSFHEKLNYPTSTEIYAVTETTVTPSWTPTVAPSVTPTPTWIQNEDGTYDSLPFGTPNDIEGCFDTNKDDKTTIIYIKDSNSYPNESGYLIQTTTVWGEGPEYIVERDQEKITITGDFRYLNGVYIYAFFSTPSENPDYSYSNRSSMYINCYGVGIEP